MSPSFLLLCFEDSLRSLFSWSKLLIVSLTGLDALLYVWAELKFKLASCAYIRSFVSWTLCSITWSMATFLPTPPLRFMVQFHLRECASLGVSKAISWACRRIAARAYFVFPHTLNINIRNFHRYSILPPSPSLMASCKSLSRSPVFRMLWE